MEPLNIFTFREGAKIENRSDALMLLDKMIKADFLQGSNSALKALRDAIEQRII